MLSFVTYRLIGLCCCKLKGRSLQFCVNSSPLFVGRLFVFNKFLNLFPLLLASPSGIMQAGPLDTGFKACF